MTDAAISTPTPEQVSAPAPEAQPAPTVAQASTPEPAPAAAPTPSWPENWAVLAAGNDDKKAQRISRYASPQALADALIEAQDKIRSGGLKVPFPVDGDDAAKSRWRTENGIPESADKYQIQLADDMVIGEGDKQMFNEFLAQAHEENLPPSAVNKVASWYFQKQEAAAAEQAKMDDTSLRTAKSELMQEWGGGYESNLDEIGNHLVAQFGQEMASTLHSARLPDGRLLGNVPEFARAMLKQARELNPGAVLVPGASNQVSAVGDRIKQIEGVLRDNPDAYWRDDKMQAEFAKLLEFKQKQNPQG
jgi:hypothetical protein